MPVEKKQFSLNTKGNCDVIDITHQVKDQVSQMGLKSGTVTIFVAGSTAAVTTIEFESGAVSDLKESFQRLLPDTLEYRHNERWGDGNGHSHIRASWIGASLTVPVYESRLLLGTWQNVVFVDFDNRPREREVILIMNGE